MLSIHQSQFAPWLPYYYKILRSDVFIIMDDVQFQKNGVQNRNTVKSPEGEVYVTIPVFASMTTPINEARIANRLAVSKFLKTLQSCYARASFFKEVYGAIEHTLNAKEYTLLHELNMDLLLLTLQMLGSETEILLSSSFGFSSRKDDLVLDLIEASGQSEYITGSGGLAYMDLNKFADAGIEIYQYHFNYSEYTQLWPKNGFIKHLSVLDLLFNLLDCARSYILSSGSLEKLNTGK